MLRNLLQWVKNGTKSLSMVHVNWGHCMMRAGQEGRGEAAAPQGPKGSSDLPCQSAPEHGL